MTQRERQYHEQQLPQSSPQPAGSPANNEQNALYDDAERLLAAGDEAISRVLSGDSQAFLEANQQTGGQ